MDWKKHLFWIVCGVVLLLGVALFMLMAPPTEGAKDDANKIARSLKDYADKAGKRDGLKTEKHVKKAKEYAAALDGQKIALTELCKDRKLDTSRFDLKENGGPIPMRSLEFDGWLLQQRQRLMDLAKSKNLQLPADFDKVTFADLPTSTSSSDLRLLRDYRIRYMAVLDDVISILAGKVGKQEVKKFTPGLDDGEEKQAVDIGAVSFDKFAMAILKDSDERRAKALENALRASGGIHAFNALATHNYAELPYTVTTVDLEFMANQSVVAALAQSIETCPHYSAVITRLDFERAAPEFPQVADKDHWGDAKKASNPPDPLSNSYWREGPVRVLLTMDLYEYKELPAPPPAAAHRAPAPAPAPEPAPAPAE